MRQYFEVLGYQTKADFDNRVFDTITEYTTKKDAIKVQKDSINIGYWYAVKAQSNDREFIDIQYSNQSAVSSIS